MSEHTICYQYARPSEVHASGPSAELWVLRTGQNSLDNRLLGEQLAGLLKQNQFPLQRLAKQLADNLNRRSPWHDAQLRILLDPVVEQLLQTPVTGSKKFVRQWGAAQE